MRMRTPLTRRFIAALLMVLLTACHSWRPTTVSPQGWTPEEQPSSVRVTRTSGEVMTVRDPIVRDGSILGYTDAGVAAVALGDVRLLEVRHFSMGQTIGLSVLLTGVAGGTIYALTWSPCTETGWFTCWPHPDSRGEAFGWEFAGGAIIGLPLGLIIAFVVREERWNRGALPALTAPRLTIRPVIGSRVGFAGSVRVGGF